MNKRVKRGRMVLLGEGRIYFNMGYDINLFEGSMESGPVLELKNRRICGKNVRLYAEIIPQGRKRG